MTYLGTRPPTVDEFEQYSAYHKKRLCQKPGLTGVWQVSGRSTITDFEEIVQMDVDYIDHWSIWRDIGILIKVITINKRGLAAMTSSFSAAICAAFGKYDVVHFHAEGPSVFLWIPKLFGKRCIVTIHGIDWARDKWKHGFGSRYIKFGEYIAAKYADEVIVLSEKVQKYFKKFYDRDVGRFMVQKNHTFLIDVFVEYYKNHKDTKLVLLGDGELMPKIKEKVQTLGIEDAVLFVGNVGNANEWYQAFDAFVLPSVWEGLPVVGVEAQAADLPCYHLLKIILGR